MMLAKKALLKRTLKALVGSRILRCAKKEKRYGWQRFRRKLSISEFNDILEHQLGLKSGDIVFVHSSMDQLNLSFSHFKVLSVLQSLVGARGTIVCPSLPFSSNRDLMLSVESDSAVFDVVNTPSVMGLLPEIVRRMPKATRSLHPTHSVCALGLLSQDVCADHHKVLYPCGIDSPFERLAKYNGKIVGLGVGLEYMTFVHTVEDIMAEAFPVKPMIRDTFTCIVRDYSGYEHKVQTKVNYIKHCSPNIKRYMHKYVDKSVCMDFSVRGNKFYVCHAAQLLSKMTELANMGITIYER